jgi:hypothetical protein
MSATTTDQITADDVAILQAAALITNRIRAATVLDILIDECDEAQRLIERMRDRAEQLAKETP